MEIFGQHKAGARVVELHVKQTLSVGRDRQAGSGMVREFLQVPHHRDCASGKVEELEAGRVFRGCPGISYEIQSIPTDGKVSPKISRRFVDDLVFLAAVDRDLPDSFGVELGVVNGFAVGRFERGESPVLSDLHRFPAAHGPFPDLPVAAAVGSEVDPGSVVRPTGNGIVGAVVLQTANRSAVGADDVNIWVLAGTGVKGNLSSVGRPARSAGERSTERGQLRQVGSVGVGAPDFEVARAGGLKNGFQCSWAASTNRVSDL